MTLTQIHYYLELCRTMNFTKAAQNLFVTQPTLSRQIQMLEQELSVELVKRSNREVILTRAGEIFRDEFSRIDDEIELALIRVKKAGDNRREIHVGFAESVIPMQVLRLVNQLQEHLPGYTIHMSQGYYTELKQQFERGLLDIVVCVEKIDCNGWNADWKCVYTLPAYLTYSPTMFPPGYQPEVSDFMDKNLVLSGRAGAERIVARQKEILKSVGLDVDEEKCTYVDDVLSSLMMDTHRGFCAFINPIEHGLMTLRLPDSAKRFRIMACWNHQSMPHLNEFFAKIKEESSEQ